MRHFIRLIPLLACLCLSAAFAIPPERLLFDDSFDAEPGTAPYHWVPLDGDWLTAQRTTRVFRQANEDITSDSWAMALWANYTLTTKCLAEGGEGLWGLGATAYDDGVGHSYRLRLGEGELYVEKLSLGEVRVLREADAKVTRGKWYSLRLALSSQGSATSLLAKVWGSEEDEPKDWLIRVEDKNEPYSGGSVGLWTGNCAGRFSYLALKQYDPAADKTGDLVYGTDFTDTAQGRLPAFWVSSGGLWVRDQQDTLLLLRQMIDQAGPLYDENASAYLQLTGYTVSTRAIAHPGPSKWGMGLVGYFGPEGSNYRLRTLDNRIYLVKRRVDGRIENLASAAMPLKRGEWYDLKLSLDNVGGTVRLQGRLWADDADEPENWQITAYDREQPLRGGWPGLWCFGSAVDFDNFQVRTSTVSALNEALN